MRLVLALAAVLLLPAAAQAAGPKVTWPQQRTFAPGETIRVKVKSSKPVRAALVRERLPATIALLQHSSNVFLENGFVQRTGCTSCHGQDLPAVVYGLARERGHDQQGLDQSCADADCKPRAKSRARHLCNSHDKAQQPDRF